MTTGPVHTLRIHFPCFTQDSYLFFSHFFDNLFKLPLPNLDGEKVSLHRISPSQGLWTSGHRKHLVRLVNRIGSILSVREFFPMSCHWLLWLVRPRRVVIAHPLQEPRTIVPIAAPRIVHVPCDLACDKSWVRISSNIISYSTYQTARQGIHPCFFIFLCRMSSCSGSLSNDLTNYRLPLSFM